MKEARKLGERAKEERIRKAGSVVDCVRAVKANSDPKIAAVAGDAALERFQDAQKLNAANDELLKTVDSDSRVIERMKESSRGLPASMSAR